MTTPLSDMEWPNCQMLSYEWASKYATNHKRNPGKRSYLLLQMRQKNQNYSESVCSRKTLEHQLNLDISHAKLCDWQDIIMSVTMHSSLSLLHLLWSSQGYVPSHRKKCVESRLNHSPSQRNQLESYASRELLKLRLHSCKKNKLKSGTEAMVNLGVSLETNLPNIWEIKKTP